MQTFLCRVLVLTFLLNCVTPSVGWGQTSRRRTNSKSLDAQVTRKATQAQAKNTPGARFAQADQQARNQHDKYFIQADILSKQQREQNFAQNQPNPLLPSSARVTRPDMPIRLPISNAKEFLSKVENNEITLPELLEYADPMDPAPQKNDLTTMTYAAEVIGNTMDYARLYPQAYDSKELQEILPQMEARLIYRLALLGFETPSYTANPNRGQDSVAKERLKASFSDPIQKSIAVGTLRLTLFKISQYYQAKKQADPAADYQKQMLVRKMTQPQIVQAQQAPEERRRLPGVQIKNTASSQAITKEAEQAVKQHGNLADFQRQFLYELRQAKSQKPEQGTAQFYRTQLLAEYATTYAMEYNLNYVRQVVQIFDEGAKHDKNGQVQHGDFQRDFSPVLNAIFNTIFENTKYSSMDDKKTKQVLQLLAEFSDPEKYSLPTRVFALEAASLLYRPFNQNDATPKPGTFSPLNFNKPDEKLRSVFARRVVELYCPLTNQWYEKTHTMQTYGLDAEHMQTLSDQLAYIYDGFYDISSAVISKPGDNPYQQPQQCIISMKNPVNFAKNRRENAEEAMWWTANVAFFVFGGDTFLFLGTAFRLTRGAIAALPKAGRAFAAANRGEKIVAFNKTVRDGARYIERLKQLERNNQVVELGVRKNVNKALSAKNGTDVPVEWVKATKVRHLKNKTRLGKPLDQEIVALRVTRTNEDLTTEVGSMVFKNAEGEATAVKGINSLDELNGALSQLQRQVTQAEKDRIIKEAAKKGMAPTIMDKVPFKIQIQPYWRAVQNWRKVQKGQAMLASLERATPKTTDILMPLTDITAEQAATMRASELLDRVTWWPSSRWGNPYVDLETLNPNMPIYVAIRSSKLGKLFAKQPVQELGVLPKGIAMDVTKLPGFATTWKDVASGNFHKQALEAFFKPNNWQNIWAKTFLPDFTPTATFFKAIKANPLLGAKMAGPTLWSNRFFNTNVVFGLWVVGDYGIFPFYNWWLTHEQEKDVKQELKKYGNTFSNQRTKTDELLSAELGRPNIDKRTMQTLQNVTYGPQLDEKELANKPFTHLWKYVNSQHPEGTLLTAPIIGARRALGMELITDEHKATWNNNARMMDLNHALLMQQHNQLQKNNEDIRKFKASVSDAKKQIFNMYAKELQQVPQAKAHLEKLFKQYEENSLKATTQEEMNKINDLTAAQRDVLLSSALAIAQEREAANAMIQQFQEELGPDFVTPAIEGKINTIYAQYSQGCAQLLQLQDFGAQQNRKKQLDNQLTKQLQGLMREVIQQYVSQDVFEGYY